MRALRIPIFDEAPSHLWCRGQVSVVVEHAPVFIGGLKQQRGLAQSPGFRGGDNEAESARFMLEVIPAHPACRAAPSCSCWNILERG